MSGLYKEGMMLWSLFITNICYNLLGLILQIFDRTLIVSECTHKNNQLILNILQNYSI